MSEPATMQQGNTNAVIERMAHALHTRDACIAGQCAMIAQLQSENEALRQALAGTDQATPKEGQ